MRLKVRRKYENTRCFAKKQKKVKGTFLVSLDPLWKAAAGKSPLKNRILLRNG